jgi:hypothetical protein
VVLSLALGLEASVRVPGGSKPLHGDALGPTPQSGSIVTTFTIKVITADEHREGLTGYMPVPYVPEIACRRCKVM